MTAHDLRATRIAETIARPPRPAAHPVGDLNVLQLSSRLVVFTPTGRDVDALLTRARRDLAGLAGAEVVHRVMTHNPDSFWAIARRDRFDPLDPRGEGFLAFLTLNDEGMKRLADGTFDASNPDLSLLTAQNEKPAGIYAWAVHARGALAAGVPLAFQKVWSPLYRDADLYAKAVTVDGHRFLETLGFQRGASYCGVSAPHLHVYPRAPRRREAPIYDGYAGEAKEKDLTVTVARTFDDLMRVVAIRSAVYIGEQECPYLEEYDGNDLSATHLLGYVGNEPAGCLRIRYFADFAKIERLAVRHEFRKTRLAFQIVKAGIELCRVKGYQRLYGHSQKRLVNFWGRFGFEVLDTGREFTFSDFDYVEIVLDASKHPQAISIGADPYLIIRPEGRWHEPGILERSASRPVTRPSVGGGAHA
ncbi:MAG: GNAT family N-acetyltransferase [Variibacter sp.]